MNNQIHIGLTQGQHTISQLKEYTTDEQPNSYRPNTGTAYYFTAQRIHNR